MDQDQKNKLGRRGFLQRAGSVGAAAAGLNMLPLSIQKALAIPAARVSGTIRDVQHVVILMQENRAFDHYFGTMRGVRGFGDRTALTLPSGQTVWHESDGTKEVLPFHLDTQTTTAMRVPGTPHTWPDAQEAWDQGRFGQWPKFKQFQSMGYYEEDDVPFQRALADAFTLCDAHHCGVQAGTLPNRLMFMTGTNYTPGRTTPATDQSQAMIDNSNNRGSVNGFYSWTTFPERLQAAGISWRIYQNPDDNWGGLLAPWEAFQQYHDAQPGQPLYDNLHGGWLDKLQSDVEGGTLPQVSWIIPNPNWSEHPSTSSPLQGASWIQQCMDILTSNPDVWSKTAFIVTFDENDGFFDHVPPPAVPSYNMDGSLAGATTLSAPITGDYYTNAIAGVSDTRPYGMGPRVPMYIVSPWSRGGWVCSQVFDHTSTIRFLEQRFGVHEPNISAWHRAVAGDLTACFDFAHPNDSELPELPDMSAATGDTLVITGLPPVALPSTQVLPTQDPGVRYSRALPYVLYAHAEVLPLAQQLNVSFENLGKQAAVFHVYDRLHLDRLPQRYTVEPGKSLRGVWDTSVDGGRYDLQVIGPNGFMRHFAGPGRERHQLRFSNAEVHLKYDPLLQSIELTGWNTGTASCVLRATSAYAVDAPFSLTLLPFGFPQRHRVPLRATGNWYDLTFTLQGEPDWTRRFAGRLETGRHGISDPGLGG